MRVKPYLKLAARAAAANAHRPDHPFKLTFAITFWCNYKCQTCNIWQKKPKDELTAAEIDEFFRQSNRFSWIDVTGGEVSLRQDFPQICESLVRRNRDLLLLHFPTNGYLTDRIVAQTREIAALRPPKLIITVSLDGDEALNDHIRGIPGGYRRQIETFRRLREIPGVDVVLGMTLSKLNYDRREQTFEAVRRDIPNFSYHDLHVNIVHESSHYLSNDEDGHRQFGDQVRDRLIEETALHRARRAHFPWHPVEYLEQAYLKRVAEFLRTGVTPMRCHALRSSCFIDSWGTVFPCTIYNRPLGSLRKTEYDLAAIWNSPEAIQVQQEIWEKDCPQCWTPCEAYPSIMGNFLRPDARGPSISPGQLRAAAARHAEAAHAHEGHDGSSCDDGANEHAPAGGTASAASQLPIVDPPRSSQTAGTR